MKILLERTSQRWLMTWKTQNNKKYRINYNNIVFSGDKEEIRAKINQLLTGQTKEVVFDAEYNQLIKTLKLIA